MEQFEVAFTTCYLMWKKFLRRLAIDATYGRLLAVPELSVGRMESPLHLFEGLKKETGWKGKLIHTKLSGDVLG